jgi:hypothetical protein
MDASSLLDFGMAASLGAGVARVEMLDRAAEIGEDVKTCNRGPSPCR